MSCLVPQDFQWFVGDDYGLEWTITDENNAPVDLTGASISWFLSRFRNSSQLVTKSDASGITITDAVNGVCLVTLNSSDNATLAGDYYHELDVVLASGRRRTVGYGTASIPT